MSSFTEAIVTPTGGTRAGRAVWRVVKPFTFEFGLLGTDGPTVTVPAGFETDGPSVPWWALPFIQVGSMVRAAALHDYLQTQDWLKPWETDLAFLAALGAEGVPEPQRSIVYLAVRWRTARK